MKLKKVIVMIILLATVICAIGQSVKAVTQEIIDLNRKASLTVVKYEHANGSTQNKPLKNVEFTIYQVSSNKETVAEAENYINQNNIQGTSQTTGENGTAEFTNLDIGRYLVAETNAPKNVMTKMESFLIDLPRSNDTGKWEYNVTVYPKNVTIYGKVVLTNNNEQGNPLKGIDWKLQKLNNNGNWQDYTDAGTLTTDSNGQISIENLEKGNYRLVPTNTTDGYILDQTNTVDFTIDENNINRELTATIEKVNVEKYIKLSDGTYGSKVGAYRTDTNSWKVVASVPSSISNMDKYSIKETLPAKLIYKPNTIEVYGNQTKLTENIDYNVNVNGKIITIDFVKGKLNNYTNVTLTYDTTFDYERTKSGNFVNNTNLIYTDNIDMTGKSANTTYETQVKSATVYTGELVCYKTDENDIPLIGAKFKIATSRENAENGIFVKDNNGDDFIAVSDGYFRFYGLKLGNDNQDYTDAVTSYWIVEIETPTYVEDRRNKTL